MENVQIIMYLHDQGMKGMHDLSCFSNYVRELRKSIDIKIYYLKLFNQLVIPVMLYDCELRAFDTFCHK